MPDGDKRELNTELILGKNCWLIPEPSKFGIIDYSRFVKNSANPCCNNKVGLAALKVDQ